MVLGAMYCRIDEAKRLSRIIREIKIKHGLSPSFEVKWTKVSESKSKFYEELVSLFIAEEDLKFRGVLIPEKNILDHDTHEQSHDDWYYKMYFFMLRYIFGPRHQYRVYLDIKDTRGGSKTRHLHEVICNDIYDFDRECVHRVQQVRSHECEILQLADLFIGAIAYENRGLNSNTGKSRVILRLKEGLGDNCLSKTSAFTSTKFNLLVWRPNGIEK